MIKHLLADKDFELNLVWVSELQMLVNATSVELTLNFNMNTLFMFSELEMNATVNAYMSRL